jgi:hypothetical protein
MKGGYTTSVAIMTQVVLYRIRQSYHVLTVAIMLSVNTSKNKREPTSKKKLSRKVSFLQNVVWPQKADIETRNKDKKRATILITFSRLELLFYVLFPPAASTTAGLCTARNRCSRPKTRLL